MRVEKQSAFVLRTQSYLETSLLVDVFSLNYGRVKLIAKGAKSGRANKASALQPFCELKLGWQGKSDLKTLTSIDAQQIRLNQPDNLVSGMYLNELLFYLTTEADPHEMLFQLYVETLGHLQNQMTLEPVLRRFEFGLLEELGYAIDLFSDVDGEAIEDARFYAYLPDSGFVISDQSSPNSATEGSIPGSAINALANEGLQSKIALRLSKHLCRSHIDLLLAGKELQSRRWYQSSMPSRKD